MYTNISKHSFPFPTECLVICLGAGHYRVAFWMCLDLDLLGACENDSIIRDGSKLSDFISLGSNLISSIPNAFVI